MSNTTDESGPEQPQDLTDLSELSFTFEESETPAASEPAAEELDINQFNLQGDSDSPLPEIASPTAAEPQWFVNSLGQALGPMPLQDVIAMIHIGNLGRGDEVRRTTDGASDWIPLETVSELASQLPPEPPQPAAPKTEAPADSSPEASRQDRRPPTVAKSTDAGSERPRKSGPKRRTKKKRKPKKDELLNEIFSEVFDEEGKVRSEEASSTETDNSQETPAAGGAAPHGGAAPLESDTSPNGSQLSTTATDLAAPVTAAAAPPQPVSPPPPMTPTMTASMQAATARPVPPAALRKKKRAGSGLSLDPKMLGIGTAVLLLIAAGVGIAMGYIPLSLGGAPDADTIFTKFDTRYSQLASTEITNAEWQRFLTEFGIPTQELAMEFMPRAASDPQAKKVADTITAMIKLMSCSYNDKETQAEYYQKFRTLVASAGG